MKYLSLFLCLACVAGIQGCTKEDPQLIKQQAITHALQVAQLQSEADDQDAARATLVAALEAHGPQVMVLEALATLEAEAKNPKASAAYFVQLAQLQSEEYDILREAAEQFAKAQNWDEAVRYYELYLAHVPNDTRSWRALGKAAYKSAGPLPALQAYQKALAQQPDNAELLAVCLNLTLQTQDAALAHTYMQSLMATEGAGDLRVRLAQFDLACASQDWPQAWELWADIEKDAHSKWGHPNRPEHIEQLKSWNDARLAELQRLEEERLAEQRALEASLLAEEEALRAQEAALLAEEERLKAEALANPPPPTLEDYMRDAQAATTAADYRQAVDLYWKALAIEPNAVDVWVTLSQVALKAHDFRKAELAALEATRLVPDQLTYTLNLLDVMQQTASREVVLAELILAKQRFPKSLELTYDLARGYEEYANNPRNARLMYQEYLANAPADHPHREEATTAYQRLTRQAWR